MVRKLIGKIRRQPRHVRENTALGIAASFTFVVAAVWLVNIPATFDGMLGVHKGSEDQMGSFFEKVSSQTAAVKDALAPEEDNPESLKALMDEYSTKTNTDADSGTTSAADLVVATSTSQQPMSTTSAPGPTSESFTTQSTYESDAPKEVRIQVIKTPASSTAASE